MAKNFRAVYRWLLPGWALVEDGGKVVYALMTMVDVACQRMRYGLEARMPRRAGASALKLIGKDRGITRGRAETVAHYAERLVRWRWPRGHRVRGNAYAALEQLSEYWGGVDCFSFDVGGNYHTWDADGTHTVTHGYGWDWDNEPASSWSRFWVGFDATGLLEEQPDFGDADLWGGALGTEGHTIGLLGATYDDSRAMRDLFYGRHQWRPAGTQPEWLIVSLDGTSPYPDSTWEHWSSQVAGVQTASRDDSFRFISLDPPHNNVYSGYPDRFCDSTYMCDGLTYAGDPTSFPTSTTLPSGATYAGDPTSFPTSVLLPDDGDLPQ